MKNFLYTSLVIAGFLFTSCGPKGGKLSISTKADFDKVKEVMNEKMGDIDYVTLSFSTDIIERCLLDQVTADYNGKMEFYSVTLDKVYTSEIPLKDTEKDLKPVKVSSFNVDEFFEVKDKAIKMLEEKSKNFGDYKVQSLRVTKTEKGGNYYYFTIIAVKQNGEISYVGKKLDPRKAFYEFMFSYNTDTQELSSSTKGMKE